MSDATDPVKSALRRRHLALAFGVLDRIRGWHEPVVYYMRMDRLVKIGTSINLAERFKTLSAQGILAIEFGDQVLERNRHRQFVDYHSHNEWFWLRDGLLDHVLDVRENFPKVARCSVDDWLEVRHVGPRRGLLAIRP